MSNYEFISSSQALKSIRGNKPESAIALRGYRYREDLTQKQLSAALGIPQSHISAIENGKRGVGKELAKKFAEFFKTDYRMFL